jgi:hypothetical protein
MKAANSSAAAAAAGLASLEATAAGEGSWEMNRYQKHSSFNNYYLKINYHYGTNTAQGTVLGQ